MASGVILMRGLFSSHSADNTKTNKKAGVILSGLLLCSGDAN